MDLTLAALLGIVTILIAWVLWDAIAPLIGNDDEQ